MVKWKNASNYGLVIYIYLSISSSICMAASSHGFTELESISMIKILLLYTYGNELLVLGILAIGGENGDKSLLSV